MHRQTDAIQLAALSGTFSLQYFSVCIISCMKRQKSQALILADSSVVGDGRHLATAQLFPELYFFFSKVVFFPVSLKM